VTSSGSASSSAAFRFPPEVMSITVQWYRRYGPVLPVEQQLAERGRDVDHVMIYPWVQRFRSKFLEAAKPRRHVSW
jgi:transposase, IS6 family